MATCMYCDGVGRVEVFGAADKVTCPGCDGTGKAPPPSPTIRPLFQHPDEAPVPVTRIEVRDAAQRYAPDLRRAEWARFASAVTTAGDYDRIDAGQMATYCAVRADALQAEADKRFGGLQ